MSHKQKVEALAKHFNLSVGAVNNWSKEVIENLYNQNFSNIKGPPKINKEVKKERKNITKKLKEELPKIRKKQKEQRKIDEEYSKKIQERVEEEKKQKEKI